jgi:hypothetical protein
LDAVENLWHHHASHTSTVTSVALPVSLSLTPFSTMKMLVIILLPLFLSWLTPTSAFSSTQPFRRGVRGVSSDSATCLAAAPKKKKAATKKTSKSSPVKEETFRKGDFVASIQEKTGLTKTDSEAALLAVLDTITTVRFLQYYIVYINAYIYIKTHLTFIIHVVASE